MAHDKQPDTETEDLRSKVRRLENELGNKKGFRFQPSISFDGVAIIVACICAAVAWGQITTVVKQHTDDIKSLQITTAEHTVSITDLRARVHVGP